MANTSLIPAGDFRSSYAADTTIFPTKTSRNMAILGVVLIAFAPLVLSGYWLSILIQIGIYAGFAASEEAVEQAAAVFAERGVAMPAETAREESLEALSERGRRLMRQLHGDRAAEGYAAPDNPVTGALYPLAIQYGYGEIWFRPGLDLRRRALVAVAAFTALKLDGQVKKFGQSALNMGLSRTEVIEAVIQTAPLTGFAPALNALGGLGEALRAT